MSEINDIMKFNLFILVSKIYMKNSSTFIGIFHLHRFNFYLQVNFSVIMILEQSCYFLECELYS